MAVGGYWVAGAAPKGGRLPAKGKEGGEGGGGAGSYAGRQSSKLFNFCR